MQAFTVAVDQWVACFLCRWFGDIFVRWLS
jgi:hypothetical protein